MARLKRKNISIVAKLRNYFITGVVVLVPIALLLQPGHVPDHQVQRHGRLQGVVVTELEYIMAPPVTGQQGRGDMTVQGNAQGVLAAQRIHIGKAGTFPALNVP